MRDEKVKREYRYGSPLKEVLENKQDNNDILKHTKYFEDSAHIRSDVKVYQRVLASGDKPMSVLFDMMEDALTIMRNLDIERNQRKFIAMGRFTNFLQEKIESRLGYDEPERIEVNIQMMERASSLKAVLIKQLEKSKGTVNGYSVGPKSPEDEEQSPQREGS